MPTRPGKKLKAEARLFAVRKTIASLSRKSFAAKNSQQTLDADVAALNAALESLEALVREYTTPTEEGYPEIGDADRQKLSAAYSLAISRCGALEQYHNVPELSRTQNYKALEAMTQKVNKYLTADLRALEGVQAGMGQTLPEALENSRTAVIKVEHLDMKVAEGGKMSSRLPLSIRTRNGRVVEGMFTKTSTYDFVEQANEILQGLIDLAEVENTRETLQNFIITAEDLRSGNAEKQNKMYDFLTALGRGDEVDGLGDYFDNSWLFNPDSHYFGDDPNYFGKVEKYLNDHREAADKASNSYYLNGASLGMERGANLDRRNSAMSVVANLLGRSDLLANAVSMTIDCGGVKHAGTFMEFVKGVSDISHLQPDDPYFDCGYDGISRRPVLKDMADLQVIDFLCGNIDRHPGNILYQFEKDQNGVTYLKGIKGIDNDASFAGDELAAGRSYLAGISQMKVISESMAATVSNLSKGQLEMALKGSGLSEKEINATVMRLNLLKTAVAEKKLLVVKDDQWKDVNLLRVGDSNVTSYNDCQGVFTGAIVQFHPNVRRQNKEAVLAGKDCADITMNRASMTEGDRPYAFDDVQRTKAQQGINAVVDELNATKNVWFGSSQYADMLTSAKALQKEVASCSEERFRELARDLKNKTDAYLDRKFTQSADKANRVNSIKRILSANSAMDFANKFLDKAELSVWDEYKQQNKEYNMQERAKAQFREARAARNDAPGADAGAQENAPKNKAAGRTDKAPEQLPQMG